MEKIQKSNLEEQNYENKFYAKNTKKIEKKKRETKNSKMKKMQE